VLIGLRRIYAVAKEKLFPKAPADDKREPHDKFSDLATQVLTVPKSEIDKREKKWRRAKRRHLKPDL
jgi:hypothetical protein